MLSRILAITTLLAFVILSAILQTTSPSTIHPAGILFVFILFYLLALGVLTFFIFALSKLVNQVSAKSPRPGKSMLLREAYYYASVIALAPVLLIAMRSIGRGNAVDIMLVIVFELIACFYVAKRR